MRENINPENKKEPYLPGFRTESEIKQSIIAKRGTTEPLDKEEQALLEKMREEDREDDNPRYGRH